jgi:DNA-binding XRE family transcriptional regulator
MTIISLWKGKKYARKRINKPNTKMSNLTMAAVALQQKPTTRVNAQQPPIFTGYKKPGNNLMQLLQKAIIAERKSQGLTQRQLAYKAGISQGTITRAEQHGYVSIWMMLRIIDALGKTIQIV